MLTDPDDVVLDIFAGSNTTGQVAETERRRWLAFELSREYVGASAFRFLNKQNSRIEMRKIFDQIEAGKTVDLNVYIVRSAQKDAMPSKKPPLRVAAAHRGAVGRERHLRVTIRAPKAKQVKKETPPGAMASAALGG
jgi:hypothetical protein